MLLGVCPFVHAATLIFFWYWSLVWTYCILWYLEVLNFMTVTDDRHEYLRASLRAISLLMGQPHPAVLQLFSLQFSFKNGAFLSGLQVDPLLVYGC